MPDFEIEGDPGGIRTRARAMAKKADLFSGTGSALRDLDTKKGWYGRSAERFGDKNDKEPTRWEEAGSAFRSGGTALSSYADALEHAQSEAERAKLEYERGQDATREAKAAYAEYEGRYSKLKSQAISDGLEYPWAKEPFTDPGDEIRKNALEILAAAKRGREDAARACAAAVRSACRNAPEKRNWLENALHQGSEVVKGAGEAVLDLVVLSFKATVTTTFPAAFTIEGALTDLGLIDGRTTEEALARADLALEDAKEMWKAAKKDPRAFGEELAKGLVDWDTWADNPARAIGHLVPDIVAGILTGGTATAASRGLRMSADAIDAVSDMSRAASGLNRAADAVDTLGDSMNITKKFFGSGSVVADIPDVDAPSSRGVDVDSPDTSTPHGESPAPAGPTGHPPSPEPPSPVQSPSTESARSPEAAPTSDPSVPGHAPVVAEPNPYAPEAPPAGNASVDRAAGADPSAPQGRGPEPSPSPSLPPGPNSGPSFLESRLGGLGGDTSPAPTPNVDGSPISNFAGEPTPHVPEPEIEHPPDTADRLPDADSIRPDQSPDSTDNSGIDDGAIHHGAPDDDAIRPGDDPVQVDDHIRPEENLNRDDYPNTQDYAGEAYNRINPYLRGEYDTAPFTGADEMIDGVKRELDSLPPTQAVSHRGMYSERSVLDRLFGTDRFSDPAFLSTSKSPDVASNWVDELHSNRDPDAPLKDKVLIRVEGHSGRDISDISLNSGEKEILFKPGTEFDVVSRRWNETDGHWEIDLREVGHPDPDGADTGRPTDGPLPDDQHPSGGPADSAGAIDGAPDSDSADPSAPESTHGDVPTEWGSGQHHAILDDHFPHLASPEARDASVGTVNAWGHWADSGRYGNNCGNCVESLELRARGYDVVANPTVQSGHISPDGGVKAAFEGRFPQSVEADWVQPDGTTRRFESLSPHDSSSPHAALERATSNWPDGSRGFMVGSWNSGGAHYFSVAKTDGLLELFDGQVAKQDAGAYLEKLKFGDPSGGWRSDIQLMRVDDLEPTERIHDVAEPWTRETYDRLLDIQKAPDSAHFSPEAVQAEAHRNERLRQLNDELITRFGIDAEDPFLGTVERNRLGQHIEELRQQNWRLETGLNSLKSSWVGPTDFKSR